MRLRPAAAMSLEYDLLLNERRAAREGPRRKRNIALLGAALLVGFLIPLPAPIAEGIDPWGFSLIAMPRVPWVLRFLIPYPLLAGVGTLVAAYVAPGRIRAACLTALGALPLLVLMCEPTVRLALTFAAREAQAWPAFIFLLVAGSGTAGIFVGARARWYRPDNRIAFAVGVTGGTLYLLSLFIPTAPAKQGLIPLVAMFTAFAQPGLGWFAVANLLQVLTAIAAAIVCLTNTMRKREIQARLRAALAFWLLIGGMILGALTSFCGAAWEMSGAARFTGPVAVMAVKMLVIVGGWMLLGLVGLTDLVIGPAPTPVRPAAPSEGLYPARFQDDGEAAASALENLAPARPSKTWPHPDPPQPK